MHTKWVKQWKSAIHLFCLLISFHTSETLMDLRRVLRAFTPFSVGFHVTVQVSYEYSTYINKGFRLGMTNVCIPRVRIFPMFFSFEKKLDGREMKKETNMKKWESNGKRCMRHIFPVIWDKGSAKVRSNIRREKYSRVCICITWMKKNSFKLPPTFSMDIHIYNFVYVTWQVLRATHISLSSFPHTCELNDRKIHRFPPHFSLVMSYTFENK